MKNSKIIVVADIFIHSGMNKDVEILLETLVNSSRKEIGNLKYSLNLDNNDDTHYLMYEEWESSEILNIHKESKHFHDFIKMSEGLIDNIEIVELKNVF